MAPQSIGAQLGYQPTPASIKRAGELALAEVLFAHLESRRAERMAYVTDGDLAARRACERAGIMFDRDGSAHARPPYIPFLAQPVELVRVHPDAPASSW